MCALMNDTTDRAGGMLYKASIVQRWKYLHNMLDLIFVKLEIKKDISEKYICAFAPEI